MPKWYSYTVCEANRQQLYHWTTLLSQIDLKIRLKLCQWATVRPMGKTVGKTPTVLYKPKYFFQINYFYL